MQDKGNHPTFPYRYVPCSADKEGTKSAPSHQPDSSASKIRRRSPCSKLISLLSTAWYPLLACLVFLFDISDTVTYTIGSASFSFSFSISLATFPFSWECANRAGIPSEADKGRLPRGETGTGAESVRMVDRWETSAGLNICNGKLFRFSLFSLKSEIGLAADMVLGTRLDFVVSFSRNLRSSSDRLPSPLFDSFSFSLLDCDRGPERRPRVRNVFILFEREQRLLF